MDMNMGYAAQLGEAAYSSPVGVFGRLQYQSPQEGDRQPARRKRPQKQQTSFANGSLPAVTAHTKSPQQSHIISPQPQQSGQFGILAPTQMPAAVSAITNNNVSFAGNHAPEAQMHVDVGGDAGEKSHRKLVSKFVVDPPDLQAWREKLFNVDETIALTQEQFETYFPHVDNVYSHRSTQRYKRKPFVSHYWDCRMKGRPPGTPKTEDPSKKRRRRSARERDLCDVKIKITEYFPGSEAYQVENGAAAAAAAAGYQGQRFWTIQRVNGNGGNGKGDGVAGPHKHTLEKSDEIKKNSVQRYIAQQDKESKKTQHPARKASGAALITSKKHSKDANLKLFAACFCPFSQRVWIALQCKGMAYQYCETDPYRRPASNTLLEANPKGCVPAIRQGEWACSESSIILEYLEDLDTATPLYPSDARLRANCRLWIDHINSNIVPAFYMLLQNQDITRQHQLTENLQSHLTNITLAADEHGPFFLGESLSLVDIHLAPFALRLRRILHPRRGWPIDSPPHARWQRWLNALEDDAHVRSTTSLDELYAETADVLIKNPAPVTLTL